MKARTMESKNNCSTELGHGAPAVDCLDWESVIGAAVITQIDSLPKRNGIIAATLYDILTNAHKTLGPLPLDIGVIARSAGYSKAAVWHALAVIADAKLITWHRIDAHTVTITVTPAEVIV